MFFKDLNKKEKDKHKLQEEEKASIASSKSTLENEAEAMNRQSSQTSNKVS